jgi:hypothetical protein
MSAYNDFESLVRSLSPALARCLLTGDVRCLDSYNRATTIVAGASGPVWRRDKKGFWFGQKQSLTAGGGALSIADAAELRVLSGMTFFWTTRSTSMVTGEIAHRVFSKRDGAVGLSYEVIISDVNVPAFYNGVLMTTFTTPKVVGARSLAMRIADGGVGASGAFFANGVFAVAGVGNCDVIDLNAPLYLGNLYIPSYGSGRSDYGFFGIFNDAVLGRAITDQEIAQLHDAWESIVSIHRPKRTISLPRKATDIVATPPLLHLAGERNAAGLLLDLSGNGRNGTISGRVTQTKGPSGVCQVAHGAGDPLIITASDAALNPANITAALSIQRTGAGASNAGTVFTVNDNLTARMRLIDNGAATLTIGETYADGEQYWNIAVPTVATKPKFHLVIRYNRDLPGTLPYVLVDGEAVVPTAIGAKVGARLANAAPRLSLTSLGGLVVGWAGCIKDTKVYGSLLTDAECRALYLDHALSDVRRLANRTDYPVSVANVVAPGKVGPYNAITGTWVWEDDGTKRRLRDVANGRLFAPSAQAYGAQYFKLKKTGDITDVVVLLMASTTGTIGGNSYALHISQTEALILYRVTGDAVAAMTAILGVGSLAVDVEYEFLVTRRARDGLFTFYIRGGAYTTWTALGVTVTDNTHTVSSFFGEYTVTAVGAQLSDVTFIPNGGTLTPSEIPWLRDAA